MWEQFLAMKLAELRLKASPKERAQWWESLPTWEPGAGKRMRRAGLLALAAGAAWTLIFVLRKLG